MVKNNNNGNAASIKDFLVELEFEQKKTNAKQIIQIFYVYLKLKHLPGFTRNKIF